MQVETYQHYLQKLGITLWVPSDFAWPAETSAAVVSSEAEVTIVEEPIVTVANVATPVAANATNAINAEVKTANNKSANLPNVCMLKSNSNARLTVIASPGNDPRAGNRQSADNLLDNMLLAIGVSPEHYELVQVAREQDHNQQAVSGKVLWVCGQLAASLLFNRPVVLASMRGKLHQVGEHRIVVSYHPDELRKNPALKKMAWQDLRLLAVALTQYS